MTEEQWWGLVEAVFEPMEDSVRKGMLDTLRRTFCLVCGGSMREDSFQTDEPECLSGHPMVRSDIR